METNLVFGASLDLDLLGIEIDENTLIPGLAVASSRAKPLAGYFLYIYVTFFPLQMIILLIQFEVWIFSLFLYSFLLFPIFH